MPGNPLTDPNWAADTTDTVVRIVDEIKNKTTRPTILAARGLVFGLLAAFLGVFAFVLLIIIFFRGLQAFLDIWLDHERSVYVSYLLVGGILCIVGAVLFRKRNTRASAS